MNIRFVFAWYDFWIGLYWDRKNRDLYILPLPMVGLVIHFQSKSKGSVFIGGDRIAEITEWSFDPDGTLDKHDNP